jgi:hypothetical protein
MITEAYLQAQCFQHHWNTRPNERGLLFMVHNNPRNAVDGARLRAMGLIKGVSDMIYLRPNRHPLCIEFKLPDGVQSKAQKEWQKTVEAIGCEYVIVHTIKEFEQVLNT